MSISVNDPIVGPSRGTADGWIKALKGVPGVSRREEVYQWIRDVYAVNDADDMPDAGILVSQALVETGNFTNEWWTKRLNAGSLGVTGDPVQNASSPTFKTTMASARAMSAHDLLYATGRINRGGLTPEDDPRYMAYRDEYGVSAYPFLKDLSGRYAADKRYAETIAERAKLYGPLSGGTTVPTKTPLTFGKVPHPGYQDRQIWKKEGVGMNNLGKRTVKGVSWHRILGSLWGTDGYFRSPTVAALTDYGVGVTATDGPSHDGEILRWNDPLGYQSGWASGTYSSYAYGDGELFVNKYGINAINRDRASIEISGSQDTPLSPKAKKAISDITAYWADQYQIPWDQFPNSPQDGFSFVCWHEEFGPDNGQKKCPFGVVKDATPELIEMTKAILKQYQTEAVKPVPPSTDKYAAPITYPWLAQDDSKVHDVNGTRVLPLSLTYTTV